MSTARCSRQPTEPDRPINYRIQELFKRFDVKCPPRACRCGAVTGCLSSFIGEQLLLDVLVHALKEEEEHTVQGLPGKPTRDDDAWKGGREAARGNPRLLDAWLLLDATELTAVECKMRTSSSIGGASVGEDPVEYGRSLWEEFIGENFAESVVHWNQDNKIALPLLPPKPIPDGASAESIAAPTRISVYWHPLTASGHWFSELTTPTQDGSPVQVQIFSASLYLRALRDRGAETLPVHFEHGRTQLRELSRLIAS